MNPVPPGPAGTPAAIDPDRQSWSEWWRWDVHRCAGSSSRRELIRLLARSRTYRPLFTARLCQRAKPPQPIAGIVRFAFRQLHKWSQNSAGIDFPWEASIGPGCVIVHGWGLVVSPEARIGANVTLFHGVTLGRKDGIGADGERVTGGAPTLEDGVWVGPHAVILGDIVIGAGARVAAGAVVTKDVPAGALVAGNPATVIRHDVPPDTPNAIQVGPVPSEPAARADSPRG